MRSTERSRKLADVDIKDYYALKVGAMWQGLRQESWAFWGLCSYLFFEYVKPQSIYTAIDFLPWTKLSLLVALLAMRSDPSVRWVKSKVNALMLLFYLQVFLSCVFAFQPSHSWDQISIVINWIILYFLIITLVNSEKRFFIFVLLLLLVNFKMSQHGARTFAMRGFAFADWGVSGSPGWFQNAGDFGSQMTVFVPLVMGFILALKSYWGRTKTLLIYLLPLTGVLSIIGTSSRGAQLALVCVAFWFILKSRVGIKGLLGLLIVGWALYSIVPERMLEKYETAGEDTTSKARLVYWYYGLENIKDYPVFGVGYNNWVYHCWYNNPNGLSGEKYGIDVGFYFGTKVKRRIFCLNPHNTFIEAASTIGVPGMILYVFMILQVFVINARTRANAKKLGNNFIFYTAHGLDAGLVGYLVSSFFITVLFYPIFWMQLALTVALNQVSRRLSSVSAHEAVASDVPVKTRQDRLSYTRK